MPSSMSMNTHLRRVASLAAQLRTTASIARSVLRAVVAVLLVFLAALGGGVAALLATLHAPVALPLLAGGATLIAGGVVYAKWAEADELVATLQAWSGGSGGGGAGEPSPPGLVATPEAEARESRARRTVRASASELARVRSEGTLVPLIQEKEAALAAAEAAWRSARAERTRSIKTVLMLAPDNLLLSTAAAWLCLRQLFYARFEALIGRIVDGLLAAGETGVQAVAAGGASLLDPEGGRRIHTSESQPLLSSGDV